MQKIESPLAPKPIGPYSQAILVDGWIYVSGQTDKDKKTNVNISRQTDAVIDQIEAILKAAGSSLEDVVKTDVFLIDMNQFPEMNAVYEKRFSHPIKPARATVEVSRLPSDGALVEISCIARKKV